MDRRLEDVVFGTFVFGDGMLANVHVSWLNPKKVREIVVVGDKKMLVWDDMDLSSPVKIYDRSVCMNGAGRSVVDTFVGFRAMIHEGDTVIPRIKLNEPLLDECEGFLEAIADPGSSLSSGPRQCSSPRISS